MSTYLSVDIDYWDKAKQRAACTRFIRKVLGLGVPTLVVLSHEELLGDANRSKCTRIEHVDYHSDVADWPESPCDCSLHPCPHNLRVDEGTWLSFVKWRKRGELLWRFPTWKCYKSGWGTCHGIRDPFREDCSEWAEIGLKQGVRGIPWHDVARVGIAISYHYWGEREAYRGVLAHLLGTETFDKALKIARDSKLSARGRRIKRAA
jgi:hypothetical protein